MSNSNNKRKIDAQSRKDSARILYTMVPCLPPPLVNLCLDYCFGPDTAERASSCGSLSSRASISSRDSSEFTRRKSRSSLERSQSLTGPLSSPFSPPSSPDDEFCRFRLRGMESSAASKYQLMSATSCGEHGFGMEPEKLTFDLRAMS